jgi:hypothetical protein
MRETAVKQIVLASRPNGLPTRENFRLEDVTMPVLPQGGLLLPVLYLSLDPYMRGLRGLGKTWFRLGSAGKAAVKVSFGYSYSFQPSAPAGVLAANMATMKVMRRIFQCSQARLAACSRQHRTELPGRLEAGDAVVEGMQRTKTEEKPFWPTFLRHGEGSSAEKARGR